MATSQNRLKALETAARWVARSAMKDAQAVASRFSDDSELGAMAHRARAILMQMYVYKRALENNPIPDPGLQSRLPSVISDFRRLEGDAGHLVAGVYSPLAVHWCCPRPRTDRPADAGPAHDAHSIDEVIRDLESSDRELAQLSDSAQGGPLAVILRETNRQKQQQYLLAVDTVADNQYVRVETLWLRAVGRVALLTRLAGVQPVSPIQQMDFPMIGRDFGEGPLSPSDLVHHVLRTYAESVRAQVNSLPETLAFAYDQDSLGKAIWKAIDRRFPETPDWSAGL